MARTLTYQQSADSSTLAPSASPGALWGSKLMYDVNGSQWGQSQNCMYCNTNVGALVFDSNLTQGGEIQVEANTLALGGLTSPLQGFDTFLQVGLGQANFNGPTSMNNVPSLWIEGNGNTNSVGSIFGPFGHSSLTNVAVHNIKAVLGYVPCDGNDVYCYFQVLDMANLGGSPLDQGVFFYDSGSIETPALIFNGYPCLSGYFCQFTKVSIFAYDASGVLNLPFAQPVCDWPNKTMCRVFLPRPNGGTAPYFPVWSWRTGTFGSFVPVGTSGGDTGHSFALYKYGLTPGTTYQFQCAITDSAGSPATVTSSIITVTTASAGALSLSVLGIGDSNTISPLVYNPSDYMRGTEAAMTALGIQYHYKNFGQGSTGSAYQATGGILPGLNALITKMKPDFVVNTEGTNDTALTGPQWLGYQQTVSSTVAPQKIIYHNPPYDQTPAHATFLGTTVPAEVTAVVGSESNARQGDTSFYAWTVANPSAANGVHFLVPGYTQAGIFRAQAELSVALAEFGPILDTITGTPSPRKIEAGGALWVIAKATLAGVGVQGVTIQQVIANTGVATCANPSVVTDINGNAAFPVSAVGTVGQSTTITLSFGSTNAITTINVVAVGSLSGSGGSLSNSFGGGFL